MGTLLDSTCFLPVLPLIFFFLFPDPPHTVISVSKVFKVVHIEKHLEACR